MKKNSFSHMILDFSNILILFHISPMILSKQYMLLVWKSTGCHQTLASLEYSASMESRFLSSKINNFAWNRKGSALEIS